MARQKSVEIIGPVPAMALKIDALHLNFWKS
jgi:hypothetical protein